MKVKHLQGCLNNRSLKHDVIHTFYLFKAKPNKNIEGGCVREKSENENENEKGVK
jgi:hypothetical protein